MTIIENEDLMPAILEKKLKNLIVRNQKLFFVHIPKNAGTTIMRTVFEKNISGHITAPTVNCYKKYSNYKNFAFCRDPFDRFISVYLWRLRKDELVQTIPIEEVIERLSDEHIQQPTKYGWTNHNNKLDRMFLTQASWMNENTTFVGRVEKTNKDILKLKKVYGLDFPWTKTEQRRHENKAKRQGPQAAQTRTLVTGILNDSPSLRNSFFDYYIKDYEKFGYNIPKGIKI